MLLVSLVGLEEGFPMSNKLLTHVVQVGDDISAGLTSTSIVAVRNAMAVECVVVVFVVGCVVFVVGCVVAVMGCEVVVVVCSRIVVRGINNSETTSR